VDADGVARAEAARAEGAWAEAAQEGAEEVGTEAQAGVETAAASQQRERETRWTMREYGTELREDRAETDSAQRSLCAPVART
jgi:hypothetical protein